MPKTDYIDPNDDGFNAQQKTFKSNIGDYAAVIGVTAAQITGQGNDSDYFDYSLKCMKLMANAAQQWTAWKNLTRDGGTPPVVTPVVPTLKVPASTSGEPVAPVFPDAVPPVAAGIEGRYRALVQIIKASPNYNEAIGQALGIEGAQHTGPDLTTVQPVINPVISGNHVNVKWGWGGNSAWLDICEIQVDRGDGKGFLLLAYDTTPNYTDTQTFPTAPVIWTYRAIYRVGDAQVGVWSLPVSLTVPA